MTLNTCGAKKVCAIVDPSLNGSSLLPVEHTVTSLEILQGSSVSAMDKKQEGGRGR